MTQTLTVAMNKKIVKLVLVSKCHLSLYMLLFFSFKKKHVSLRLLNFLNELKTLLKCNPSVIDSDKYTYLESPTVMFILNKNKYDGI